MVRLVLAVFSLLCLTATTSHAIWPVYHEPAFDGRVLDFDTKQPLEGAVVVVVYNKRSIGAEKGQSSTVINIKEALTDKDGKFHIPSYTTIMAQPFTRQDRTGFLIYKPGYASIQLPLKNHFIGKAAADRELSPWYDPVLSGKYKIRLRSPGIIELPRLASKDERLRNLPELPDQLDNLGKQKNLTRLINEEKKELGEPAFNPYKVRQDLLAPAKGQK
ncbi:carboxypeptidase-like regulatory domain-containing protein [Geomonas agri]|uniref:carboxypeptidase-like regulatory domain-containing protein n=1 Tax=Geomonas agri TaxID=2873702 RepID=UPI001CD3C477|nr:carboxypeptidase-like regulatory domain-containing protein [Geomonas agri]